MLNKVLTGYVLQTSSNQNWVFVVVSGHHRVAVLTALAEIGARDLGGIPVRYASGRFWSSDEVVFYEEGSDLWPAILAKSLKQKDALEMFKVFVDGS